VPELQFAVTFALNQEKAIPQGLKSSSNVTECGTAEAAPFVGFFCSL
jgi:hypothetical protein